MLVMVLATLLKVRTDYKGLTRNCCEFLVSYASLW